MGIKTKLTDDITTILNTSWDERDGTVVPKTEDVTLKNGAVNLDVAVLYADLWHSTQLQRDFSYSTTAKIVRAYLSSMTQIVKDCGGHVRSFDGDRVMGIFIGKGKNTEAGDCALKMSRTVDEILRPKAESKFPSLKSKGFVIRHSAGVAASKVLVVRGGVREYNDLVFVGEAPNLAAKLSELRDGANSYITAGVYGRLNDSAKLKNGDGVDMWTAVSKTIAGELRTLYKSDYRRDP